jgi:hypothetical protein
MQIRQNLCNNALRKAGLLIVKASELGMDLSGYGEIGENLNSGNVYLWQEDYPFCLYIGLGSDTIYALWTDNYDGDEVETDIDNMSLDDLIDWALKLENEAESCD